MSIPFAHLSGQHSFEYNGVDYNDGPVLGKDIGYPELDEVACYYMTAK